jgi:hypothetical protein
MKEIKRRSIMTMREVYEKLVAEYPGRAISVEYAISTFKKPCTVYVDTWEQSFQAATWERALDLAENKEISPPPDEDDLTDCNIHGTACGGTDGECPKC